MIEQTGSEVVLNGLSQVGFPIAAFYLMYDFAKKSLQKNTDAVNNLALIIKQTLK